MVPSNWAEAWGLGQPQEWEMIPISTGPVVGTKEHTVPASVASLSAIEADL